LGTVVAFVYTIEFQKRGISHVHLMVTLEPKDRPTTAEKIDCIVSAELANEETSPRLYALIKRFMLHGPCKGRPCWNGKSCKYGYPRPYTEITVVVDGSYPVYLRRDDGQEVKKANLVFTNQHVVPFNKFLTLMFKAHINVEIPVNSRAVKYLYKYITKGHDRSHLSLKKPDKTKAYLDTRYVGPPEGLCQVPYTQR
jgi:hypothetical protein